MKKFASFTLLFITIACINTISAQPAHAATLDNWRAGNIIDDSIFYDNSTMSANDVQAFLNSKTPVCDTNGTRPNIYNPKITNAQYAAARGWAAPPYVCLKDYFQIPRSDQNINNLSTNVIPSGAMSAAQIIKSAADTYGINPKVLIVILQKESPGPLVTDTWPLPSQFRNAMGYGCPDTAPCDPTYEGFYNQVMNAARQFKLYKTNSSSYRYKPYQVNSIYYNPVSTCGADGVTITNIATAGLYNYTPYQPNQSALAAGYGTGNSCGAYGNRNFYLYFNDWFGSTRGDPFAWSIVETHIYDETKSTELGTDNLHAGERLFVSLKVKNIGTEIWYRDGPNPITLATSEPRDHMSKYCDTTWLRCNRVSTIIESSIAPGEEGHFEFYIAASNITGEFREYFTPVLENRSWMTNDTGFHIYTKTNQDYAWRWGSLRTWSDSARTIALDPNSISPGQQVYVTVYAQNTSATIWNRVGNTAVRLATSNPKDRNSIICNQSWLSCNRLAPMNENIINPGQIASFSFTFTAPMTKGEYREYVRPVLENKGWTTDTINHIYFKVQ